MNMYEIRSIDLKKVQGSDFINFLRIEIPERKGYGPVRFARVRYALNGNHDEQENGLPMDLGKGIFTATLEDEELGGTSRQELEKTLRKAAVEIVKIVREELDLPSILNSILKDYPYLKYDKHGSEPPDVLRCHVTDPKSLRQVEDIFEIARRLSVVTNENYSVGSYSGHGTFGDDDNFDKMWTRFSLRKFDFQKIKSK